jgi:plastocyanin
MRRWSSVAGGLAIACALLALSLPACEDAITPAAPPPVTATPMAPPPTPPTTAPSPPELLLACQAQPRAGAVPLTVRFRSFPSGGTGEYAYDWQFGDGAASTQPHPRHTYESRGAFLATLRVTSGGQVATCERAIEPGTVPAAPPAPAPGASPSPGATPIPDLVITIVGDQGASSYSPSPADARVGQRVLWHNGDVMTHTATGSGFSTGFLPAGADSAPITMGASGTFNYGCLLHSGMSGTLRVAP